MRFRRTIRRIGKDLIAFRNMDAYVVSGVGVALIVVDVLGDVPYNVQLTVIIAALVVLVVRTTAPPVRHAHLNDFLHHRNEFGTFREFIKGARTLWVYAPSAVNILRDPAPITQEILDKGHEVIVLVQNPDNSLVIENLQKQLDIAAVDLKNDIHSACHILRQLRDRVANKDKMHYGLLPYSPGFSLVIVDAERASGRLIVEFFGYQNEFIGNRMHIQITRQQSEYWFDYWVDQFRSMLASADMISS